MPIHAWRRLPQWDTAAAQGVLEGAGGVVLQLDGEPFSYPARESLLNQSFLALPAQAPWRENCASGATLIQPCGRLARDASAAVFQPDRAAAIASKPVPTKIELAGATRTVR